jgi:RNA polymerase sigma-70 factor (ECF subfamily)
MSEPGNREADIPSYPAPLLVNENQNAAGTDAPETEGSDGRRNDIELLCAYVRGDEQAFETLVRKYFRMVYTVAARQTGDPHLAEEIAQSVFLILSRKARGFPSRGSVPGWLLRTTRFVAWDAIKMRRRRDQNERKLAVNLEPPQGTTAEPGKMELLLEEAIQALRPEEQAGIVARFFEGKDFREIAEMFAISEHAARKRTSRCLAKLQAFMRKRGSGVSLPTLSRFLVAPPAHPLTNQAWQAALQPTHAVWKGNVVAPNALAVAERAMRLLRWRFLTRLSLRLALVALVIFFGVWTVRAWNRPAPDRIENLGKAWGALDQAVAQHRQFLMLTAPNAPNYQGQVQEQLGAISRESSRIMGELSPLLAPPNERTHVAKFLTAGLVATLNLEPSQKTILFSSIQKKLAQGATLRDGMKALAQSTRTEAAEIRAMLLPGQRQRFDEIYGADGVLLFSYAKVVALGKIGP